jgi:hypothetical protein
MQNKFDITGRYKDKGIEVTLHCTFRYMKQKFVRLEIWMSLSNGIQIKRGLIKKFCIPDPKILGLCQYLYY